MEETILNPNLTRRIYSVRSIRIATLIGGPLVAAYLMAANFKQFDESGKVIKTWLISIAIFLTIIILSLFLPDSIPSIVYSLTFYIIVSVFVQKYQAAQIEAHISSGGLKFKTYRAVLIALGFVLAAVGVIFACLSLADVSSI